MKLHKAYRDKTFCLKGLSIIEIIIVLGIISLIFTLGFFLDSSTFQSSRFLSEEKLTASLLRAARSRAVNNFNQSYNGLFINDEYFILFKGDSFVPEKDSNEVFPRNDDVKIYSDLEGQSEEITVIFENLTGRPILGETSIFLSSGRHSSVIEVFNEGRIEW